MKKRARLEMIAISIFMVLSTGPYTSLLFAEDTGKENPGVAATTGSFFLSLLNVPFKFVTCVSTQVAAGTAYVLTAGVPGNYDEGTNGEEIGEIATGACSDPWIITPHTVKEDYKSDEQVPFAYFPEIERMPYSGFGEMTNKIGPTIYTSWTTAESSLGGVL